MKLTANQVIALALVGILVVLVVIAVETSRESMNQGTLLKEQIGGVYSSH